VNSSNPFPLVPFYICALKSWVKKDAKLFAVATARLNDADGPIALVANAIFIQVSIEHFLQNADRSVIESTKPGARDFEVNP